MTRTIVGALGALVAALCLVAVPSVTRAELMLVANDEKVTWDDAGKPAFSAPGKDTVAVVEIGADRETPKIVAALPLMNSVFGPPTNLAITPDGRLAVVANSMDWVQEGGAWKGVPGRTLHLIDLEKDPPAPIGTVEVGRQPSGLAINRRGDLMLVANRADHSVSVLAIQGKAVRLVDTVPIPDQPAAVAFTPDGRRALVARFAGHKIALLDVDGQKVTYAKQDVPTGLWPYNVEVTPDGKLALTADNGNAGTSDGHVDTVTVIDLEANPPRAVDRIVVGDAPEGLAISPTGQVAVAVLLKGSNLPKSSWFYNRNGSVVVLRIDGKRVTRVAEVEVEGLPEGAVFTPDGKYLYVGNFLDRNVSILKVDGASVVNTGKRLQLPGRPASMRGRTGAGQAALSGSQ